MLKRFIFLLVGVVVTACLAVDLSMLMLYSNYELVPKTENSITEILLSAAMFAVAAALSFLAAIRIKG